MGEMQGYGYGTRRSRGHQFVGRQVHTSSCSPRSCSNGLVRVSFNGAAQCGRECADALVTRPEVHCPMTRECSLFGGANFFYPQLQDVSTRLLYILTYPLLAPLLALSV